jgi:hypothetical protein
LEQNLPGLYVAVLLDGDQMDEGGAAINSRINHSLIETA